MLKVLPIVLALALTPATCQGPDYAQASEPPEVPSAMPYDNSSLVTEIRWGDAQTIITPPGLGGATSGQLVRVDRPNPETWTILLVARLVSNGDAGGAFKFDVTYNLILGSGSSQVTFAPQVVGLGVQPFSFHFDSTLPGVTEDYLTLATPYGLAYREIELPLRSLTIQAVVGNELVGMNDTIGVEVSAFAAPRFYPPIPAGQDPPTKWMPPGFNPTPTHY
jgi:hypothetical protein